MTSFYFHLTSLITFAVFSSGSCVHTLEDTKYITLIEEKVTDYLSTLLRFSFILRVYKTVRNMLLKMKRATDYRRC